MAYKHTFQSWMEDVRLADEKVSNSAEVDDPLPPVRNSTSNINMSKVCNLASLDGSHRRISVSP